MAHGQSSRPIRVRKDESDEEDSTSESRGSSPSSTQPKEGPEDRFTEPDESNEDESEDENLQEELRDVSFGALVEAQKLEEASTNPSATQRDERRLQTVSSRSDAEKVNSLRARLQELKQLKETKSSSKDKQTTARKSGASDLARSSKHAPAEQSSRRAVGRFRPAIEVSQNPYHSRDPRFASLSNSQQNLNEDRFRRNYAFLTEYKEDELANLRSTLEALKKKKRQTPADEAEMDSLKRNINSIENKLKSDREKERERRIVRDHKKEERGKIKEGKKPFFLKKGELKKMAEQERMDNMKAKQRDRVLQKRRKRQSEKERRAMPRDRRAAE